MIVINLPNLIDYSYRVSDSGHIGVTIDSEDFYISSEWSASNGQWYPGSTPFCDVARKVTPFGGSVLIVEDTITNLTSSDCPIRIRHQVTPRLEMALAAGLPYDYSAAAHPTIYTGTKEYGLGMVWHDDITRNHNRSKIEATKISLNDNLMVLPPGAERTTRWAIIPSTNYWDFATICRRLLGGVLTIPPLPSYFRISAQTTAWSNAQVENYGRCMGPGGFVSSIPLYTSPNSPPVDAHGTAFQHVDLSTWTPEVARRKLVLGEIPQYGYFHCWIDVHEDAASLYPECAVRYHNGQQAIYDTGHPQRKLFFPHLGSRWGDAILQNLDILYDIGFNGIYFDEVEWSKELYHYGEPWDFCSGDISDNGELIRRKTNLTLVSEAWRIEVIRSILSTGRQVLGNQAPCTLNSALLRAPRFVEVPKGLPERYSLSSLYTPISLPKGPVYNEIEGFRRGVEAINHGSLPLWWYDVGFPITRRVLQSFCTPVTPEIVQPGIIAGEDAIILTKPATVGWTDKLPQPVIVLNADGVEIANTTTIVKEVGNLVRVDLPFGWLAVIRASSRS